MRSEGMRLYTPHKAGFEESGIRSLVGMCGWSA